ncbi:hypothetical protein PRK78_005213 [Emydomyces testavorans]|uniref:Uncharacterized protein n=1 Tax=Emydomyces testavorans TaxID=2070801 RepID=A0AAF0DJV3_9EURO|nr:hypothetical protein PRK78_005213 [Emydomyces testavorans]
MMNAVYSSEHRPIFEPVKIQLAGPISHDQLQAPNKPGVVHRHSIPPETNINLFEDLPTTYDPSTWWLDGHSPAHPHFDEARRIQSWVKVIKQPLFQYILEGCKILLERADDTGLLSSIDQHELLWKAGVSMLKYGVVYLATRSECREEFLPAIDSHANLFRKIDSFLSADAHGIRAMNYGVHRLVNSGTLTVDHQQRLVPPTAISSIGPGHITVRAQDFGGDSVWLLDNPRPIWDLHDFAHLTAASLSPDLFGSKYFVHLIKLPPKLTALIRSPKMKTAEPTPRYSDGVVFSELLTVLFTAEVEAVQKGEKTHTYASLTETLANYVAEYLLGQRELQHLTTGTMLRMEEPISAVRLAVLVQNKAYELTASEIEQRVLTRGGPVGDMKDELDGLTASERIRFLAGCRRWMYFEVRNTIKHRAHKLAYQKVAQQMLKQSNASKAGNDRVLLERIMDNIHYQGWEAGRVPNLWQTILDMGRMNE